MIKAPRNGHDASNSEFLLQLNQHEQDRARLRALLLHGMESGNGSVMNDDYFDQLRERILNSGTS